MIRRIRTARLTVNVRVEGEGPHLLFLGGSSFDLGLKAPVFTSALAARFTIAAADPRGLGRTDQPDGPCSMEDYARDALALLDALDWPEAMVLSESFGGMVALHMTALAPDRVTRLALAVTASGGPTGRSYPIHEFRGIDDPRERAARVLTLQDRRFAARPEIQKAALIEERMRAETAFIAHANNANGHARLLDARARHDAVKHLPHIAAPTLILSGRFDDQSPLDLSETLVRQLPNARLEVIDGGHGLLFNEDAAIDAVLSHFEEILT